MKKLFFVLNVLCLASVINLTSAFAQMKGGVIDFGNFSSSILMQKAWSSSKDKDFDSVVIYANKIIELYSVQAAHMQAKLKSYPSGSKQEVSQYWALNDVGTALFVLAETYRNTGHKEEARKFYQRLIKDYSYAQCWNRLGWFWKPSEAAQKRLDESSG